MKKECKQVQLGLQKGICSSNLLILPPACLCKNLKSLEGDLNKNIGAPRYTTSFLSLFMLSCFLIARLLLGPVCFEKKIPNLPLLILCPNHVQYFSRQSTSLFASFIVALEKRTMSSVYMTCVRARTPYTWFSIANIAISKLLIQHF